VVEVSDDGVVLLESVRIDLEAGRVALVSVMAANNETGAVQPWEEVADLCAAAGVPFHCDAVQWFGKAGAAGFGRCTFVSGSAHKFGGPKGTGFLLVPEGDAGGFTAQAGGPQESGRRAGTEDVAGAVAMVAALEAARPGTPEGRDGFERDLLRLVPGTRVLCAGARRLWNTSMVLLPGHKNLKWLTRLDRRGFQVSTGSACSAGRENPSEVMEAIGLGHDEMGRVLRASGGAETTAGDWQGLAAACAEVWQELSASR
jgi:cysteine desulfurase